MNSSAINRPPWLSSQALPEKDLKQGYREIDAYIARKVTASLVEPSAALEGSKDPRRLISRVCRLEKAHFYLADLVYRVELLIHQKSRFQRFVAWLCYALHSLKIKSFSTLAIKRDLSLLLKRIESALSDYKRDLPLVLDARELLEAKHRFACACTFSAIKDDSDRQLRLQLFFQELFYLGYEVFNIAQGEELFKGQSPMVALTGLRSLIEKTQALEDSTRGKILMALEAMIDLRVQMGMYMEAFQKGLESSSQRHVDFYRALKKEPSRAWGVNQAPIIDRELLMRHFQQEMEFQMRGLQAGGPDRLFYIGVRGQEASSASGHALICSVQKNPEGSYQFTVFNTGVGCLEHHPIEARGGILQVYPFTVKGLTLDALKNPVFLSRLLIKQLVPSQVEESVRDIYAAIQKHLVEQGGGVIEGPTQGQAYPLQVSGSCTYCAFHMWLKTQLTPSQWAEYQACVQQALTDRFWQAKREIGLLEVSEQQAWQRTAELAQRVFAFV